MTHSDTQVDIPEETTKQPPELGEFEEVEVEQKHEVVGPPPPPAPRDEPSRPLMLTEFALMYHDAARVETLGAFLRRERSAGRVADTAENYLARLAAFRREQH